MNTLFNVNNTFAHFTIKKNEYKMCCLNDTNIKKQESKYKSMDTIHFGCKMSMGKLPKEFIGIKISNLNEKSPNVSKMVNIGNWGQIIKYIDPQTKTAYAIKRLWHSFSNIDDANEAIKKLKAEAEIYKQLGKSKELPKFHYYNHDISCSKNSLSNNYLIMNWLDGKTPSNDGFFYDFKLIDLKAIKNTFKSINKLDEAGVIHDDLWAGNILIDKNKVHLIDFDSCFIFNPKTEFKNNNLSNLKLKFLHPYFSDIYQRQGEEAYLKTYKECLKLEISYNRKKELFYLKNKNIEGCRYYKNLNVELSNELKDSQKMRTQAIQKIFNSSLYCAELYAKSILDEGNLACYSYKRILGLMKKHPQIVDNEKFELIKSNLAIVSRLKEAANSTKKIKLRKIKEVCDLINNQKIYTNEEKEKPYYEAFKSFLVSLL